METPPASLADVAVLLPACNEAESLTTLLPVLTAMRFGQIIVADNASTDGTGSVAAAAGATVVREPRRGYGAACAAGLTAVAPGTEIIVFLDADQADDPAMIPHLVRVLREAPADLVIGCRDADGQQRGAMTIPQRFGNWLATTLIRLGWRYRFRDLGPLRAIRRQALARIDMRDRAYGWTVEMQVRAVQLGLRIEQVSVPYRRRIGTSKISGTVRGVALAGYYILTTIARLYFRPR